MTSTNGRRPDHIKFSGRILFLTDDTALIRQQLEATGDEAAALRHGPPGTADRGLRPPQGARRALTMRAPGRCNAGKQLAVATP